ncbi:MAG: hypothetical protein WD738_12515 [Pirellulales bacterium]
METNNHNNQQYELVGELISIFERGTRWYAYYRVDGKPVRQSLKTGSKKQARSKALAIERDLVDGEVRRPARASLIKDVIEEYIAHLRANGRSEKTVGKYEFAFKLVLELAERRGLRRISQIDLALIDAFRAERNTCRVKPKKEKNDG